MIIDNKYGAHRRTTVGADRSDSATSLGPRYHLHQAQPGTLGQVFSVLPSFVGGGSYFFLGMAYFFGIHLGSSNALFCSICPVVAFVPFLSFIFPVYPRLPLLTARGPKSDTYVTGACVGLGLLEYQEYLVLGRLVQLLHVGLVWERFRLGIFLP